jgi:hypothetical protein
MKERPILFSAPMVRAILEGRKTVTRRIIKPTQPREDGLWPAGRDPLPDCPYGQPSDRLWVRETWMPDAPRDGTWEDVAFFGCKGSPLSMIPAQYRTPEHVIHRASWDGHDMVGWKPSIHMPRWASRITLEVTGVRIERLQDITPAQILAEGVRIPTTQEGQALIDISTKHGPAHFLPRLRGASTDDLLRAYWAALWVQINGIDSWHANPWVWVVQFKRLEQPHA